MTINNWITWIGLKGEVLREYLCSLVHTRFFSPLLIDYNRLTLYWCMDNMLKLLYNVKVIICSYHQRLISTSAVPFGLTSFYSLFWLYAPRIYCGFTLTALKAYIFGSSSCFQWKSSEHSLFSTCSAWNNGQTLIDTYCTILRALLFMFIDK